MSFTSRVYAISAALFLTIACSAKPVATPAPASVPHDPSSYANTEAFVVRHLVLDLAADFDAKTLSGTAELHLDRRDPKPAI
jgi:hypothetical protein